MEQQGGRATGDAAGLDNELSDEMYPATGEEAPAAFWLSRIKILPRKLSMDYQEEICVRAIAYRSLRARLYRRAESCEPAS